MSKILKKYLASYLVDKKRRYLYFSTLALLLFSIAGCEQEDVDITPPWIETIEYNPTPKAAEICGTVESTVFELKGGERLVFDVIFNDDKALAQYKVDIHNNFDCHGHGGGSAPSVVVPSVQNKTTDWTVLEIQDISGNSFPVTGVLNVPENVTAGNYHYHLQVIDEAGNDSPFSEFFSVKITNPDDDTPPQIIVQEPANGTFSVRKGDTIQFSGQVTDDRSLSDGGNGVLYLAYTDLSSGNTFTTDEAIVFDEKVDVISDFNIEYVVPQTLPKGNYRFSLGANDGVRNVAQFKFFEIEVTD